jgi:hypothetical protein
MKVWIWQTVRRRVIAAKIARILAVDRDRNRWNIKVFSA